MPPSSPWQQRLEDVCREYSIQAPVFQIVSDRRGGRTAWSSVVQVYGRRIEARFWYDGKNLNNAKEDAAEAAYNWLSPYLQSTW
ncbi:uncharacterized protein BCR38DRAFT_490066 [Pseudomassariella vexata]|uniref:DRBM domain-containing protein n=1 Tax=Pseudomassariella vexata TaxID=1141098 RepID=A0A1Y2DE53_9PEZI|nr:uncharacterized protein BCR38DRAFT_490066 [Pseudomassariella vexata]ORY57561.1 hypothetical protein BCR38DRAFT_490066 [Pseudomassariella vexata]